MRTALGTEPRLEKGAGSCGARLLENRCSVLELVVVMQRSVLSEGELAGLSRLYAHTPLSLSAQQLIQSWLQRPEDEGFVPNSYEYEAALDPTHSW